MKLRWKHRLVLFLCLLVLGEEFAIAKTIQEEVSGSGDSPSQGRYEDEESSDIEETPEEDTEHEDAEPEQERQEEQDADDDDENRLHWEHLDDDVKASDSSPKRTHLVKQRPVDQCGGKKGWVSSLFKAFKIGVKVVNYGITITSLSTAIYKAVKGCTQLYPDAEKYHNDFLKKYKEVEKISEEADELQHQSQLDQNYVQSTADMYRMILCKLDEIDKDSERLLQAISSEVVVASLNASEDLTKLVAEKNATMDKVSYITAAQLYDSKLTTALSVGLSALALALPAGIDIFKFSKKRYTDRYVGKYELDHSVDFDIPSGDTPKTRKSRFGQWIGRQQARFKTKIADLEKRFNVKFDSIKSVATKFLKGLDIGFNLVMAGYQLYETITSLTDDCRKVRDTAKKAYDDIVNATETINAQMAGIKQHKAEMDRNWGIMRDNVTDKYFLESVGKTKTVMENSANQSQPMLEVARGIGEFLGTINTSSNHNVTYDALRDLYNFLIKVPFAFVCYKNKIKIINNVVSECKRGDLTLRELIEREKNRFDTATESEADSPRSCKDNMGIDYLPDEKIAEAWKKTAELEGFHEVCYINNPDIREAVCNKHKGLEKMTAEQIVKSYTPGRFQVADIQKVIDALPIGFTSGTKELICNLRNANFDDESIRGFLKDEDADTVNQTLKTIDCTLERQQCFPPPPPKVPEQQDYQRKRSKHRSNKLSKKMK